MDTATQNEYGVLVFDVTNASQISALPDTWKNKFITVMTEADCVIAFTTRATSQVDYATTPSANGTSLKAGIKMRADSEKTFKFKKYDGTLHFVRIGAANGGAVRLYASSV